MPARVHNKGMSTYVFPYRQKAPNANNCWTTTEEHANSLATHHVHRWAFVLPLATITQKAWCELTLPGLSCQVGNWLTLGRSEYIHTWTCLHLHTYICAHHTYIHIYIHTALICIFDIYIYRERKFHTLAHTYVHTYLLSFKHIYILTCKHSYMYAYVITYRHSLYIHT